MPVKHNLGWTQAPLILEPGQAIVARFALESGSEQ
ncbi:MAG: hypothetical protein BWZ10_02320 [candidate division BRC1 bacterium ADurb.BinA364]|nr:MAG: hypothetical protein BWZ10_02320 [candidate division BRC1 bacterium ADurb.BinA364]